MLLGMITPLFNQWLVQLCSNQTVLLDENAQVINKIIHDGYNVTLIDRDRIVFLDSIGIKFYQRDSFICFINNKRL